MLAILPSLNVARTTPVTSFTMEGKSKLAKPLRNFNSLRPIEAYMGQ